MYEISMRFIYWTKLKVSMRVIYWTKLKVSLILKRKIKLN